MEADFGLDSGEFLEISGKRFELRRGDSSVAISIAAQKNLRTIELRSSEGVRLRMFGVVPHEPDVAPPPPEPYDAGPSEESDDVVAE